MSRFVNAAATLTIHADDWEPSESVQIRPKLSFGDKLAIEKSMFTVRTEKGDVSMEAELTAMKQTTLERMIVGWTFTDEQGQPVPVTPDTIRSLDAETAEYIYEQINAQNPPRTKDEQQD